MRYSPFVGIDGKSELLVSPDVVKRRTTKLAEQIHRKADYFKHNTILSPIGDDFRFVLHYIALGVSDIYIYVYDVK